VDLGQGQRSMAEIQVVTRERHPGSHVARLFTPSSPPRTSGLGLGLALCHRIIASIHGAIQIRQATGRGTAVSCFLPIADERLREEANRCASIFHPRDYEWPYPDRDDEGQPALGLEKGFRGAGLPGSPRSRTHRGPPEAEAGRRPDPPRHPDAGIDGLSLLKQVRAAGRTRRS